jgi:hypothetical protein
LEDNFDDPNLALPLDTQQIRIYSQNQNLLASAKSTPVSLSIEMRDARLVVEDVKTECQLSKVKLAGCYNCATGGRIFYTCRSSFGTLTAQITCEDYSHWQAECHPEGKRGDVILTWTRPNVATRCEVDCGGKPTFFLLNGTLIYLNRASTEFAGILQSGHPVSASNFTISFPSLDFIFTQGLGSLRQQLLAFLAGAGLLALFCTFLRFTAVGTAFLALLSAPRVQAPHRAPERGQRI